MLHAQMPDYPIRVLAGLACWNFLVNATTQGCQCLFLGESYIRQYPAPIAIYPLRTALGALIHFLLALGVVIGVSWYFKGFGNLAALPSIGLGLVLIFLLAWSMALIAGFANVYFQDTQHLCEVGFQILFYATPIIYDVSDLGHGRLARLVQLNPLIPILKLFREPILEASVPGLTTYGVATLTVTLLAGLATLTLWRLQKVFIFHL
jgi:ABC-type polysaccharide/polyol phosphate export permease